MLKKLALIAVIMQSSLAQSFDSIDFLKDNLNKNILKTFSPAVISRIESKELKLEKEKYNLILENLANNQYKIVLTEINTFLKDRPNSSYNNELTLISAILYDLHLDFENAKLNYFKYIFSNSKNKYSEEIFIQLIKLNYATGNYRSAIDLTNKFIKIYKETKWKLSLLYLKVHAHEHLQNTESVQEIYQIISTTEKNQDKACQALLDAADFLRKNFDEKSIIDSIYERIISNFKEVKWCYEETLLLSEIRKITLSIKKNYADVEKISIQNSKEALSAKSFLLLQKNSQQLSLYENILNEMQAKLVFSNWTMLLAKKVNDQNPLKNSLLGLRSFIFVNEEEKVNARTKKYFNYAPFLLKKENFALDDEKKYPFIISAGYCSKVFDKMIENYRDNSNDFARLQNLSYCFNEIGKKDISILLNSRISNNTIFKKIDKSITENIELNSIISMYEENQIMLIQKLIEFLKKNPSNHLANYNLGVILFNNGLYKSSSAFLKNALFLDQNNFLAEIFYSFAIYKFNEKEASSFFNTLLDPRENNPLKLYYGTLFFYYFNKQEATWERLKEKLENESSIEELPNKFKTQVSNLN